MFDRPRWTWLVTGMVCVVGVSIASCSQRVSSPARPPTSIAAPPRDPVSAPSHDPEIASVWADFWSRSWPLDQVPQSQWQPVLSGIADGALADQLMQRKTQDLARGLRLYGQVQSHVTAVQALGDQALVTDCQDASRAGQADLAGHPRTVGVARHRVQGTVVRRVPGGWRVSRVDYQGGGC